MKPLCKALLGAAGFLLAGPLGAETCNPLSRDTCVVPFPSDFWAAPHSSSPTGKQLAMPDGVLRPLLFAQLPVDDGFSPSGIFGGASGFSAGTPVIFEFNARPVSESLPEDGGDAVVAWNLSRGEPVAIRAEVSEYAQSDRVSEKYRVIEIFPVGRWPHGERILVALTRHLQVPGDDVVDVSTLCSNPQPGTRHGDYCIDLVDSLGAAGLSPVDALSATVFTVRDRAEMVETMRAKVEKAWDRPHPVRHLKTHYDWLLGNHIAAVVTGEVRLDDYRTHAGGNVDFDAAPKEYWTSFRLTLPDASLQGGAPVALYVHGLGLMKEGDLLVSSMNASLGVATFSIDLPHHGDRGRKDGGHFPQMLQPDTLTAPVGMMNQVAIDLASAHKALVSDLKHLDVLAQPHLFRWCWTCGDGKPDLDTSRVLMQGTSLGGVLATTYASLAPELEGGMFRVGGLGIASILSGSVLWDEYFSRMMPTAANGAEAVVLRAFMQHAVDPADGINFIELMRDPDTPRSPRPLLILSGAGDTIVPNYSTTAAAQLADLPLVGKELYHMPGIYRQGNYDRDGSGVLQYPPLAWPPLWPYFGPSFAHMKAHLVFLRPEAIRDQEKWMKKYFVERPEPRGRGTPPRSLFWW